MEVKNIHSGDYTYKDDLGEEQHIFFSDISVNDEKSTIARGEVDKAEPFKMGSKFIFKGTVNLTFKQIVNI